MAWVLEKMRDRRWQNGCFVRLMTDAELGKGWSDEGLEEDKMASAESRCIGPPKRFLSVRSLKKPYDDVE